jgi:hypothetical protein
VRDPDRAGADGDARRGAVLERERARRGTLRGIQLRQSPLVEVPDPHGSVPDRDGTRPDADLDLVDDLVRVRVDDTEVVRPDAAQAARRVLPSDEDGDGDEGKQDGGGAREHRSSTPERLRHRRLEGVRRRRLTPRRRKLRRQAGRGDLVQAHGALDVLEPLVAQIAHPDGEILLLVLEQALRRLRDEDLASVACRADAGGAVDGEARVAAVDRRRLTCVHADPHLYLGLVRPRIAGECALSFDSREHGLVRAPERVEERVSLRVDLVAPVRRERLAQQPLVLGQHLRVAVAQSPDQQRRPLDIREDERHRAAREIRHRCRKRATGARRARVDVGWCDRAAAFARPGVGSLRGPGDRGSRPGGDESRS